jgi:hypothetical protein
MKEPTGSGYLKNPQRINGFHERTSGSFSVICFFFPDSLAFKLFSSSVPGVSTMKILFASLVWAEGGFFLMGTAGYIPCSEVIRLAGGPQ